MYRNIRSSVHKSRINAVAVAPDGSFYATAAEDGAILRRDLDGGQEAVISKAGSGPAVNALAIAPGGAWLATGDNSARLRRVDLANQAGRYTIREHVGKIRDVSISPNGEQIGTVGGDGVLNIRDAGTGQRSMMMRVDSQLWCCTWLADGKSIAVGGGYEIYVFDIRG
ncbi:MAG TPA: WD40 repeat domain-containing protein [Candidatus Limnocylindrales bacterium]|nr:WD40 repeat domain-containing protein [Candidatus Limnocylindrales bacterium]